MFIGITISCIYLWKKFLRAENIGDGPSYMVGFREDERKGRGEGDFVIDRLVIIMEITRKDTNRCNIVKDFRELGQLLSIAVLGKEHQVPQCHDRRNLYHEVYQ